MPAARQEHSIFAVIALALLFIIQGLGLHMPTAHGLTQAQMALLVAAFYAAILIGGLILPLLSTPASRPVSGKTGGILSPLPLFLVTCTALLFAGHVIGPRGNVPAFCLRSAMMGLLWVTGMHAFFLFAPPNRKGLLLGLAIAAGELIWIALLPGMHSPLSNAAVSSPPDHLYRIQMVIQCVCGLLLAVAFALRPAQTPGEAAAPIAAHADNPCEEARARFHRVLPRVFFAATLVYIAYGLTSGLALPRIGNIGMPDSAHILLLITMPLAGALFDRGGRGCRLLFPALAVLAFAAPSMFLTGPDGVAREALYALLCVERQGVMLATLLLSDRLLWNRKRLPLLLALAYILPVASMAGRAVDRADVGLAFEAGIALVLALAFAFLALRLRGALSGLSSEAGVGKIETPVGPPDLPVADGLASDPGRLVAFATTHGLSKRETSAMEMLAQGRSTEDIARAMNVAENTVRTYVKRMLQKTGTPNRDALMELFAAQTPAPTRGG